jgi:hypothetical protein
MRRPFVALALAVLCTPAFGCGKSAKALADAGDAATGATRLAMDGIPDEVREGEAVHLSASFEDESGVKSPAANVSWSVVPPEAGRIEQSKLVPLGEGSLEIVGVAKEPRGEGRCSRTVRVRSALLGEWERQSEPYKGLRISIQSGADGMKGVVTTPPPVTEERLAKRAAKTSRRAANAELVCQRSTWNAGEAYLSSVARAGKKVGGPGFTARAVVRDWGLAPRCQHRDVATSARLELADTSTLVVWVTRPGASTPVEQRWSYIGP